MKKDFLAISDYAAADLQDLLDLVVELKKEHLAVGNLPLFK